MFFIKLNTMNVFQIKRKKIVIKKDELQLVEDMQGIVELHM